MLHHAADKDMYNNTRITLSANKEASKHMEYTSGSHADIWERQRKLDTRRNSHYLQPTHDLKKSNFTLEHTLLKLLYISDAPANRGNDILQTSKYLRGQNLSAIRS